MGQRQAALDDSLLIDEIEDDPEYFLREILREPFVYEKQCAIIKAVGTHPYVSIVGCNSSGKDWLTGRILLWWMSTRYPAVAVVFGPTQRQVEHIVWKEARYAYHNSAVPLGGSMLPKSCEWHFSDKHYALGFTTGDELNITGFHSEHLLIIVTEAHAMSQAHMEKIKTLHSKCMVMTGNPFTNVGEFYESHHEKKDQWKTFEISAFDTPNVIERRTVIPGLVTIEDVERAKLDWGEDNPLYVSSVMGQFPDDLGDSIVTLSVARRAMRETIVPPEKRLGPKVAAVDIARRGTDKTVLVERQGNFAKVVWKHQGKRLTYTAGRLKIYLDENPDVSVLILDDVGVGGGVTDIMLESEHEDKIYAFQGGTVASDQERFSNRITEAWWKMRDAFNAVDAEGNGLFQAPDDGPLLSQVISRKWEIQSDKRIKLEDKEKMRRDGIKSPDEADALAMTFTVMDTPGIILIDDDPNQQAKPKDNKDTPALDPDDMEGKWAAGEDF